MQLAYQFYSVTDKDVVYQQALHGSGLATINAEQTLEIQTGLKNKSRSNKLFCDGTSWRYVHDRI